LDTQIGEGAITGTSHSVSGLTASTQYSFRVCAINANATPDVASGVTASEFTLDVAPPNITGLSIDRDSTTQLTLNWTSGGGSTADYRIAYKTGATAPIDCASDTQIGEGSITGTSHSVSGLTADTQYSFIVCAINSNPTPDVASGVTASEFTLKVAPPQITGLTATPDSATQITLDWTSGGGSTADYRIAYKLGATAPIDCASDTQIGEGSITGTSHAITGLTGGTEYSFRVCAINDNPTPDVAAGVTISDYTLAPAPPNITGLTANPDSDTQITLNWTSGGGSTTDYRIAYKLGATAPVDCASDTQIGEGSITGTSHAITGLSANTEYSFKVCAINSNPTPDVASGVNVTETTLFAVPPQVTGLTATPDSTTQITLDWTSGGGLLTPLLKSLLIGLVVVGQLVITELLINLELPLLWIVRVTLRLVKEVSLELAMLLLA
jgi:hypothetical protein